MKVSGRNEQFAYLNRYLFASCARCMPMLKAYNGVYEKHIEYYITGNSNKGHCPPLRGVQNHQQPISLDHRPDSRRKG